MRLLIYLILSILLSNNLVALDQAISGVPNNDTLHAFVDDRHNAYFKYQCQPEYIASDIARKFHVRESDMLLTNPAFSQDSILSGRSVLIPFNASNLLNRKSYATDCIAVVYNVRPKETLFKIARRYFDLKVDQLRRINDLSSNDISIGQRLIVGWFVMHPVTDSALSATPVVMIEPIDPFFPEEPTAQIGVAFWKKSPNDSAHLFAMHRTARINSMIEITNPMFKNKVLVKVVGRIPPTYKNDIALVVSPAVAKKLGVLDPRFRAEMRFVE